MRAVIPEVPDDILALRKRTGADRWDEMWEGVLHMPPAPNPDHQDIEGQLETWLRIHWARPNRSRVYHNVHLGMPPVPQDNYRIPDLILLTPECRAIRQGDYFVGAPAVVIEIKSPRDESREKMHFYAQLGVPEAWIIDRDTRVAEVYGLRGGGYVIVPNSDDGWVVSPGTGIRVRAEPGDRLAIQMAGDPATRSILPEDDPWTTPEM